MREGGTTDGGLDAEQEIGSEPTIKPHFCGTAVVPGLFLWLVDRDLRYV